MNAHDPRPSLAVFDIDGVLADVRHRLHFVTTAPKDWRGFFRAAPLDPPLAAGIDAVLVAQEAGHLIVYLTGRPEWCRRDTIRWLAQQDLPTGTLYMRDNWDRRPARLTKLGRLKQLADHNRIETFVDDDAAVVEAVRAAGFSVHHARWMGTEADGADGAPDARSAQDVLFEIQEKDART